VDSLPLSRPVGEIAAAPGSRAERAEAIAQGIRIAGRYRRLVRVEPGARIAGIIDIESDRVDAFTDTDRALIENCAVSLVRSWQHRAVT
jgi:hypothetical protein